MTIRDQQLALLVDFGSTYTKLVAVNLEAGRIVAHVQAPTTVETDINIGLWQALAYLEETCKLKVDQFSYRLACSSAAGGLRIIAIGLVKSLTVEAARQAALGAGARIVGAYGDQLTTDEIDQIVRTQPDMILLAGGIDGGDRNAILHNAAQLAESPIAVPIILAGNKNASPAAEAILRSHGKEVRTTENVLPRLQEINVEPARETIRRLYMERIVQAKGLDRAESFIGQVVMPTPAAVLQATRLLADGTTNQPGWEAVMVVDIGGATTDVHSVAPNPPAAEFVIRHGLPEAHAKRTVEGDLGLRVSAISLLETVGMAALRSQLDDMLQTTTANGMDEKLHHAMRRRTENVSLVPEGEFDRKLDEAMAFLCVEHGTERHVGHLREHYLPTGFCLIQDGKDLTQVKHVIGTGGIFLHTNNAASILSGGLFDRRKPHVLKPAFPELHLDRQYALWAMGLLAESHPDLALDILKQELPVLKLEPRKHGGTESKPL